MGWGLAKRLLKRESIAMLVLQLTVCRFAFILLDFHFLC